VFGRSSLTTMAVAGRITLPGRVKSSIAKPEARVEKMEMAAMRVNFIIGRRLRYLFVHKMGDISEERGPAGMAAALAGDSKRKRE